MAALGWYIYWYRLFCWRFSAETSIDKQTALITGGWLLVEERRCVMQKKRDRREACWIKQLSKWRNFYLWSIGLDIQIAQGLFRIFIFLDVQSEWFWSDLWSHWRSANHDRWVYDKRFQLTFAYWVCFIKLLRCRIKGDNHIILKTGGCADATAGLALF